LPSNNSTRCVGALGGSFVCASKEGTVVANRNASANRKVKNDFMRKACPRPAKTTSRNGVVVMADAGASEIIPAEAGQSLHAT
jgi:hypothetical protein